MKQKLVKQKFHIGDNPSHFLEMKEENNLLGLICVQNAKFWMYVTRIIKVFSSVENETNQEIIMNIPAENEPQPKVN